MNTDASMHMSKITTSSQKRRTHASNTRRSLVTSWKQKKVKTVLHVGRVFCTLGFNHIPYLQWLTRYAGKLCLPKMVVRLQYNLSLQDAYFIHPLDANRAKVVVMGQVVTGASYVPPIPTGWDTTWATFLMNSSYLILLCYSWIGYISLNKI